jgi:hypothetical protein
MTENDKNDLKVPRFDSLNKALSRDTKIKVWTQAVKCASLSRFGMKGAALFQALHNTKPGKASPMLHFARAKKMSPTVPSLMRMTLKFSNCVWFRMMAGIQTSSM